MKCAICGGLYASAIGAYPAAECFCGECADGLERPRDYAARCIFLLGEGLTDLADWVLEVVLKVVR